MNDIRITKLPNTINPNNILEEQIKKRYGSKCPFCGETRSMWDFLNSPKEFMTKGIDVTSYKYWYGKQYEIYKPISFNPKYWFQKRHHWKILCYSCRTCRATWDTPPFPTDVMTQKELDKIFSID